MNRLEALFIGGILDSREVVHESDALPVIKCECKTDGAEVLNAVINSLPSYWDGNRVRGLGTMDENGATITIRIHREVFLDGKELVRLLEKRGSPTLVSSDDVGLTILTGKEPTLLTAEDFSFGTEMKYTFDADVEYDEALEDGKYLSPLYFFDESSVESPIYLIKSGDRCYLHGSSTGTDDKLLGIYMREGEEVRYSFKHNDLKLYVGDEKPADAYEGYTFSRRLSYPLYSVYDKNKRYRSTDYFDMKRGIETRWCARLQFKGCRPLSTSYQGTFGAYDLYSKSNTAYLVVTYLEAKETMAQMLTATSPCVHMDSTFLYVRFEDGTNLDEETEKLESLGYDAVYGRSTFSRGSIGDEKIPLYRGVNYIEICSDMGEKISVKYIE